MNMRDVSGLISEVVEDIVALRHEIHENPELCYEESGTAERVLKHIGGIDGLDTCTRVAETGIVATLDAKKQGPCVALRADMDALPMDETNDVPYRSKVPGKMHACGHDGHTSCLVGAVRVLSRLRDELDGPVKFIFQPAEEGIGGAKAMVEDGLFDQFPCDSVYGMHNRPGMAVGKFGMRSGAAMAGGALFDITVHGNGSHGARPEAGIDPVIISAHIATAVQTIVSRNANPQEMAVLSITQIQSGDAYNVIPHTALLKGTARTFSTEIMSLLEKNLTKIATNIAEGMGARAEVDFRVTFPPLINDEDEITFTGDVAASLVGEENVNRRSARITASEDFSYMSNLVPGGYITIGLGEGRSEVHNPNYDFNDEILPLGATYWAKLVEKRLAKVS